MDRDQLLKEMARTVDELRVFNEIGKTLTSTLDISEVLSTIMLKISELMKPHHWSLLLMDEDKRDLTFEIVVGEGADKLKDLRLPLGEGVAGWVAKEAKPLLVPDAERDERWLKSADYLTHFRTRSILCVPLIARGDVLGVIELVNHQPNAFSESDLRLLGSLADYAAIAIENARNFLRIQELTVTDDVTSLYNSRHLHEMLAIEFERSRRYRLAFSVIFFDLDHFKKVNDQYGHLRGSKLLKEVGELVRSKLRTVDIPTRYGGDEFVIILPQTSKAQALRVTRRLRQALNDRVFLTSDGLNVRLTASFGVANFPEDTLHKDNVLRLADEAMYRVKESTRDGIQSAEPDKLLLPGDSASEERIENET